MNDEQFVLLRNVKGRFQRQAIRGSIHEAAILDQRSGLGEPIRACAPMQPA
ncbi:hypothetical protein LMG28727_06965 [Paraburkholderia kirstenboschensis]|nr:hypothetical protein LMG28727_06965 [Paraburkholderia kirstenboschensis]